MAATAVGRGRVMLDYASVDTMGVIKMLERIKEERLNRGEYVDVCGRPTIDYVITVLKNREDDLK